MNNPLARYKLQDPMLEWSMIEKQTGIKVQTLLSIASKNEVDVGKITLANAEILKRKLGVDMGMFYNTL